MKRKLDETNREQLLERISRFLDARVESDNGGWAPCSKEDFSELCDIVHQIVEAKFEADCDGDVPVQVRLVNRTTCEHMHCIPLPYAHKARTIEELDDIIATASCNVGTAVDRLNSLIRVRKCEAERITREGKRP